MSQKEGKAQKDLVQVYNRYVHVADLEDEAVWNLPVGYSPSPIYGSPPELSRSQ